MQPDPGISSLIGIVDWLIRGGLVAFLLFVLFGGHLDLWRYGSACRRRDAEVAAIIAELRKTHEETLQRVEREYREHIAATEKDRNEWKEWAKDLLRTTRQVVQAEETRPRS